MNIYPVSTMSLNVNHITQFYGDKFIVKNNNLVRCFNTMSYKKFKIKIVLERKMHYMYMFSDSTPVNDNNFHLRFVADSLCMLRVGLML